MNVACRRIGFLTVVTHLGLTLLQAQVTGFPYVESFDGVTAPTLPTGWTASGFTTSATTSRSLPNNVSATGNQTQKHLTSPALSFTGKNPDKLTYFERRSSTAIPYRLEVRASTDGTNFNILLATFDTISTTAAYVQRTVDLSAAGLDNTASVYVRWLLLGDNTNTTGVLRIDDVSVTIFTSFDVAMRSISISPSFPSSLDSLTINARVRNLGTQSATSYNIDFYRDANSNLIPETGERFASMSGPALSPNDSALVTTGHLPLPFGDHRFFAIVAFAQDEARSNDTLSTLVSVGYARGSVLINEIMYAPSTDEPEWVEFFNPTADTINMRNWRISDNNVATKTVMSATDFKIAPSGYAIVAKDANFFTVHPTVTVPVAIANFSALNNTTPDAVVLYDNRLATMDSVLYAPSWGGQGGKSLERIDSEVSSTLSTNWATSVDSSGRTPGRRNSVARLQYDLAIELSQNQAVANQQIVPVIVARLKNPGKQQAPASVNVKIYADFNRNSMAEETELIQTFIYVQALAPGDSAEASFEWTSAPSGEVVIFASIVPPTGFQDERLSNNSAMLVVKISYEPRTLVVNEIMYDPLAGQNEWVEFLHRGNAPLDLARWQFSDQPTASGSVNTFTITTTSRVIQPGDYVVAAADSTILSLFPSLTTPSPGIHLFILNRSGGFSLGNDGDDVVLRDHTGATIDSVSYSPKWHHPDFSDTKGRSLERINPNLDSNDPRNWSTATPITGGTPGNANSIFTLSPPSGATISISPNPFSPDGDGHEDFCIVRYSLPTTTSLIRVRIFDIKGRMLRTLANLEPSGAQGELIWDGLDDTRQRVRIGIYIVLVEAADSQSQTIASARAVVVVATKF